jgi:hypothetical protein
MARNGLTAARPAVIQPVRRSNKLHPAHMAAGTVARANSSDNAWVAGSEEPKTRIQPARSTWYRGGEVSWESRSRISVRGCDEMPSESPSSIQYQVGSPLPHSKASTTSRPARARRSERDGLAAVPGSEAGVGG